MAASLPLAVVAVLLLLLAASTVVPATAGGERGGGGARVVIIRRGAGTAAGGARANDSWRYGGRLLEDEVAPELFGGPVGAVVGGGIRSGVLKPDSPGCPSGSSCAAKGPGQPYTQSRGCTYVDHCPHPPQ